MTDEKITILGLIFDFLKDYWHWLVLILIVCSIPAYIAISYNSTPWGSYTIAIGSALGLIISLYENRRNLLEEREINKKALDKQFKQARENLIEQLSRKNKEKALFKLLNESIPMLNEEYDDSHDKGWITDISLIVEGVEDTKSSGKHSYFGINMFMQNDIYHYFKNLINDPYNFFYLPPEIQKRIIKFNDMYYDIHPSFILFLGLRVEGNLHLIDKFNNAQKYKFSVVDKDSKSFAYYEIGNYINKHFIDKNWLTPNDYKMGFVEDGKEAFVLKIDDDKFNALEKEISCIYYLAYKESLKYGYNEIN